MSQTKQSSKSERAITEVKQEKPVQFSGVARSLVCFDNNGFRNFKIQKLTIKDGVVVTLEMSDAYASFEAITRLELANEMAILNLNNNWKDGESLSK